MKESPIGIFDSGLGGLTVVKAVLDLLPNEKITYVGDTARVPYGNKSKETIERYSLEISRFLVSRNVKMIIIACNSASSLGLDAVRAEIDLPILGVIGPGARTAVKATRNKKIGVIGTRGTINSSAYMKALRIAEPEVEIFPVATPLLVPLVEEGWSKHSITRQVIKIYLDPLLEKGIDTLILGCTHYPFLKTIISEVLGDNITLVDSAEALAVEARNRLIETALSAPETLIRQPAEYFSTDSPDIFIQTGSRLIDLDLTNTQLLDL